MHHIRKNKTTACCILSYGKFLLGTGQLIERVKQLEQEIVLLKESYGALAMKVRTYITICFNL